MFHADYYDKYPESFDPKLPRHLAYTGKLKLTDLDPVTGLTFGKLVLSPTRTYLPVIKKILDKHRSKISGIIHNTGGAHTKVMNFVENLHIIKDNLLPLPRLFHLIHEQSGTDYKEMFKVFNMGQRLEIYTDSDTAHKLIEIADSFHIKSQVIGRVEGHKGKKLTLKTEFGEFVY
jgi:phosphoribosylformylglycinamidine cyclo-ligase